MNTFISMDLSPEEAENENSFKLRSQCLRNCCPFGKGLQFNSRISPSPSKSRLRSKRLKKTEEPIDEELLLSTVVRRIDFDSPSGQDLELSETGNDFYFRDPLSRLESDSEVYNADIASHTSRNKLHGDFKKNPRISKRKTNKVNIKNNSADLMNTSTDSLRNETFVPGKEFFSSQENRNRLTSDYFSGSDTPSKLRESTRRLTLRKSNNNYIVYSSDEELENWWEQGKTDYTYSASISYRDQVTPERRVGSPNMSRRGMGSTKAGFTPTSSFSQWNFFSSCSPDSLSLRSREVRRSGLSAYSDESDEGESQTISTKSKKNSSRLTSVSRVSTSTRRYIHNGLDVDSDIEEPPKSKFAKPILRRSLNVAFNTRSSNTVTSTTDSSAANINGITANDRLAVSSTNSSRTLHQGRGYRLNEEDTQYSISGEFLGKIYEWSYQSWVKTKHVFITICTYLALWRVNGTERIINLISKASNLRSHNLDVRETNGIRNTRQSRVTNTTVLSRRRTITTFTENIYSWYREKKSQSPFLWWWLPICLLLLTSLLLAYYFTGNPSNADGNRSTLTPSESFNNIFSEIYSLAHLSVTSLQFGVSKSFSFICDVFYYLFDLLWIFFSTVLHALRSGVTWTSNFMYGIFSDVFQVSTSLSDTSVVRDYWPPSTSFSPLVMISNIVSTVIESIGNGINFAWVFITEIFTYGVSFFFLIWNLLLWTLNSLWLGIGSVLSTVWLILSYVFNGITYGISKTFGIIYLLPFLGDSKVGTTPYSDHLSTSSPVSQEPSVQFSIDEIVKKILASAQLQTLIADSLKEENIRKDLSRENVDAIVKLNVETEVNKIRLELIDLARSGKQNTETSSNDILSLKSQQEVLRKQLSEMESTFQSVKTGYESSNVESVSSMNRLEEMMAAISLNIDKLSGQLDSLQSEHYSLSLKLSSCCDKTPLTLERVEEHLSILLSDLIDLNGSSDEGEQSVLSSKLGAWMNSYFVAKSEMESQLEKLWDKVQSSTDYENDKHNSMVNSQQETEKQTAEQIMNLVLEKLRIELQHHQEQLNVQLEEHKKSHESLNEIVLEMVKEHNERDSMTRQYTPYENYMSGLNETQVQKLVKEAIFKYDADKTGLVDHALESAGGSIVSTRCTEEYQGHKAELFVFGYSLFHYSTNTPRSIIQPDRQPGQCYAFKGSQGYIVIRLAGPVKITTFSVEHIPKIITPSGHIDSAPKDFSVYGLQGTSDEGFHFGNFMYDDNGDTLQYFPVQNSSNEFFDFVELKVLSNHGNMNYTCFYRFRVHGIRQQI